MSTLHHFAELVLAVDIPDPPPAPLPGGAGQKVEQFIGMLKTGCFIAAMIGGLASLALVVIGIRGRSEVAKSALTHLPYVFGGAMGVGSLAGILQVFAG